jgi:CMP/dCMP kinase
MIPVRVIAIDGAAGSGKSTLGRGLGVALGLPYVNTGSMYRALTLAALEAGVGLDDEVALADLMRTLRFTLSGGHASELWIESSPPSAALMSADVDAVVSTVARHPQVRALMRDEQRRLAAGGAVMEGRDIASVVFPQAPVKIYLVADPAVRAERRSAEREGLQAAEALRARDEIDAGVNPFEPQPDAVVIDTTSLDVEATLATALRLARERMPEVDRDG